MNESSGEHALFSAAVAVVRSLRSFVQFGGTLSLHTHTEAEAGQQLHTNRSILNKYIFICLSFSTLLSLSLSLSRFAILLLLLLLLFMINMR